MNRVKEMNESEIMELAKKLGIEDSGSMERAALALAIISKQQEQEAKQHMDATEERPGTEDYLEIAPAGTLVAYWNSRGYLKSAAIVSRNPSQRLVKIETKYGYQTIISYDDVEWVKAGKWWPKEIYNILVNGIHRDKRVQTDEIINSKVVNVDKMKMEDYDNESESKAEGSNKDSSKIEDGRE